LSVYLVDLELARRPRELDASAGPYLAQYPGAGFAATEVFDEHVILSNEDVVREARDRAVLLELLAAIVALGRVRQHLNKNDRIEERIQGTVN
jgi:hypothetical protein